MAKLKVELKFQFSRSSGPGGQKVNKTETQVELRWSLKESSVFNSHQKERISNQLKNDVNKLGELVLASDQFRSREQNKKACIDRFQDLLERSLYVAKKRRATRPTKSSVERRISDKKKQSETKKNRNQKWSGEG